MDNTNTQDAPIMNNEKETTLPISTEELSAEEAEIVGEELETVSGGLRPPPLGR